MPTKTIIAEFDPAQLPAWAKKHPEVTWLCERSLSFRADVFNAREAQYRRFLVRQAQRRYRQYSSN